MRVPLFHFAWESVTEQGGIEAAVGLEVPEVLSRPWKDWLQDLEQSCNFAVPQFPCW